MPIRTDDTIRCAFCGRTQDQVRKMIAGAGGSNVFICDECIELCSEILEEELEKDELIIRKEFPQIPPKVEYSLSKKGESFIPILHSLCQWGLKHRN